MSPAGPPQQTIYGDSYRSDAEPFLPTSAEAQSALDIGCGRGGFGRILRRRLGASARIVGMDAAEENVASARVGQGFDDVFQGYFPGDLPMSENGEKFDLITFLDVLEHMIDPWDAVRTTSGLLTPRGRVVAVIPSIQYWPVLRRLLSGRWDYVDAGTLDRTHLRFFTKATIRELFEQNGFHVARCEGINPHSPTAGWKRLVDPVRRIAPDMTFLQFAVVAFPSSST